MKKTIEFLLTAVLAAVFAGPARADIFPVWGHGSMSIDDSAAAGAAAMGVSRAWLATGLPVRPGADGDPAWRSPETRERIVGVMDTLWRHGIRTVPLLNVFYEAQPQVQRNRWGIDARHRSFAFPPEEVLRRLDFFIDELKAHPGFGGIIIDDEPGVVVGGDVDERALELFGAPAPPADAYPAPPGVIEDDDARLRWFEFQAQTVRDYYAAVYRRVAGRHPGVELFTIPAAPYHAGLQLSSPDGSVREMFASMRSVTLDAWHEDRYHFYVQYFVSPLSGAGWEAPLVNGLWCAMQPTGLPQFCPKPVFAYSEAGNRRFFSPEALKRAVLQTLAEGGGGICYSPAGVFSEALFTAGREVFNEYIEPLRRNLPPTRRLPGTVAILYSDATRALADLGWNDPLERYRQLHHVQALAYYLAKRGIPFEIVTENAIGRDPGTLARFPVVLAAGVAHITAGTAAALERHVQDGGKLIADRPSAAVIPGAAAVDLDAGAVYRALLAGTMSPDTLEYQAGLIEAALGDLLPDLLAPAVSSSRQLNIGYREDGGHLYLFLVNDNLFREAASRITLRREALVGDVLAGTPPGEEAVSAFEVTVPAASMKVLRLGAPARD